MTYRLTFSGGALVLWALGALSGCSLAASSGGSGGGGGGGSVHPPDVTCSASGLMRGLLAAKSGDTVKLEACTYEGSFSMAAGVTLIGAGVGQTILHGPAGKPALKLAPGGAVETKVSNLSIVSDGTAAVIADGKGLVTLDSVDVTAHMGIGVGVQGASSLLLKAVTVTGPVTLNNAISIPYPPSPQKTATHGVVLVDVADAKLSTVTVSGFADYGALFVRSTASWVTGGVTGNLGTGLMAVGGSTTLDGLHITGNFPGDRPIASYGAVFTDQVGGVPVAAATVRSTNLDVTDNKGIGLFHDGASVDVQHTGLKAGSNDLPAIWAQGSKVPFVLQSPMVDKNIFAGLVAIKMASLTITGGHFDGTKPALRSLGANKATITVGDGLHLVESTNIHLDTVDLNANERVGLLLAMGALDPLQAGLKWVNVTVEASPSGGWGALCQDQSKVWQNGNPQSWDLGIVRDGSAFNADAKQGLPGPLDIVGLIAPEIIPAPLTVIKGGLSGIISP